MKEAYFTFDGKSSLDFGLKIQNKTAYTVPRRDYNVYDIAGVNSIFVSTDGKFEPFEYEFDCTLEPRRSETLEEQASRIAQWLRVDGGFKRLTFSKEREYFYQAFVNELITVDTSMGIFGEVSIKFFCKPQKFLFSGQNWLKLTKGDMRDNFINNLGTEAARPLIKLNLAVDMGKLSFYLNGNRFLFYASNDKEIYIDCETYEIYNEKGHFLYDRALNFYELPELPHGKSKLKFSKKKIESIEILPRWWRV